MSGNGMRATIILIDILVVKFFKPLFLQIQVKSRLFSHSIFYYIDMCLYIDTHAKDSFS
jgi:hypothetical protein